MKKRTLAAIILSVALATVATTAYAASYEGKIWTGKPTIFGIGYYCTAAQINPEGIRILTFNGPKHICMMALLLKTRTRVKINEWLHLPEARTRKKGKGHMVSLGL